MKKGLHIIKGMINWNRPLLPFHRSIYRQPPGTMVGRNSQLFSLLLDYQLHLSLSESKMLEIKYNYVQNRIHYKFFATTVIAIFVQFKTVKKPLMYMSTNLSLSYTTW